MSLLEERYRSVLRLLPAWYRLRWEDDMVSAFLESSDTGDPERTAYLIEVGRPSVSEIGSVVCLAVRLRLGGVDAAPRPFAWGQAVRLAVLMATLANAVMLSGGIVVSVWLSGRIGWLPAPPEQLEPDDPVSTWHAAWILTQWAWVPAYLALTLGRRHAAQMLAMIALLAPAGSVVSSAAGAAPLGVTPLATLAVDGLLVAAMAAFRDGDPPGRRSRWLLALPLGVLLVPVPLFAVQMIVPGAGFVDGPGLACLLMIGAIAIYQVGAWLRPSRWTLPAALALTLLAATVAGLRLLTLLDYYLQVDRGSLVTTGLIQAAGVLGVGIPLAATTVRAFGQLPPLTATAATTREASLDAADDEEP